MNILLIPMWAFIGVLTSFFILKSQWWSVMVIHPSKPSGSKWLIIGGAIIRWLIIALILIMAGYYSIMALFIVFISFMISRILILTRWQISFNKNNGKIH